MLFLSRAFSHSVFGMSDTGLPYDGTPPPESATPQTAIESSLDRPFSEHSLEPQLPEHVKSLMGRMSRGKVYLLEESTGIIHSNDGDRSRGDPVRPYSCPSAES